MTKDEENSLKIFETRVRQLILEYKDLKKDNYELRQQVETMKHVVEEKCMEIDKLKNDYATLKLSRMIDISSEDLNEAKSRIAKLIREVDKCIALLNV
jgi:cell division septum initiation protein DivIVA